MPFVFPGLADPQLIKGRRECEHMLLTESKHACESTAADGAEDYDDGISKWCMVKKERYLYHVFQNGYRLQFTNNSS